MRVALIDYDSGNLHSAEKAFQLMGRDVGAEIVVTADPQVAARADRIVLPGDGAFPACRTALGEVDGMAEALREGSYDTVLGPIAFNEKGDVKEPKYVMYQWSEGKYAEL